MSITVTQVQRLRCMDEEDRRCTCGERITARWCESNHTVSCVHCARSYEMVRAHETPTTQLPMFTSLTTIPRSREPE